MKRDPLKGSACIRLSERLWDHAMCCGMGGERIAHHNHLQDAVFQTSMAAKLDTTRKGRFLLAGNNHCPADVLIPNWAGCRDAALYLTLVTSLHFAPGSNYIMQCSDSRL